MTTTEHQPQVAQNLSASVPTLIAQVNAILTAVGAPDNAIYFANPPPNPPLATIAQSLAALVAKHAAVLHGGKGSVAERSIEEKDVRNHMGTLAAYVQTTANSMPGRGSAIILASGFSEKLVGKRTKALLEASQAHAGQPVLLVAKAAPKGVKAFYGWRYTVDGKTYIQTAPTNDAHILIPNLPPLVEVEFQVQITIKNVPGAWSPPVTLLVK